MKLLNLLLCLMLVLPAAPTMAAGDSARAMHDGVPMQQGGMTHDCCDGVDIDLDDGGACCQNPACGHCIVMPAVPVRVQFIRPASPGTYYASLSGAPVLERQIAPPYRPPCV